MSTSENDISPVQVALRIRPLVDSEILKGYQRVLQTVPNEPQVYVKGTDKAFTYNHVFDSYISQEQFYNQAVKHMVCNLFKGYNVTVLAYGQTGSGKTHTMGTTYTHNEEQMGVIQRAINDIFAEIATNTEYNFEVTVSFMELYQELLYDLLAERPRDQSIVDIREDIHGGIRIAGLTELTVTSAKETGEYLRLGSQLRVTGATAMNTHSSRSHAIITIAIQQQNKINTEIATTSKFHLVDLAGSERPKKTKATGERFREGIKINQGLLALGNVISALGDENQKLHSYISYRDSKLTRLLQDSLGGNSITLMIACVSPASYNVDETLSTLRYADRARKIKNKPLVNQDSRGSELAALHHELNELRSQLLNQSESNTSNNINETYLLEIQELKDENQMLRLKNEELTEQLHKLIVDSTSMFERSMITENGCDKLQQNLTELIEQYNGTFDKLHLTKDQEDIYKDLGTKIEDMQSLCKLNAKEILHYDMNQQQSSQHPDLVTDTLSSTTSTALDSPTSSENDENFENNSESHMRQQLAFSNQLQELTRSLALKEQLASQIAANCDTQIVDKISLQENEQKIVALMKEKDELLQQLKNVHSTNQSNKLAEQRRNRVQELETQIQELNKKVREQLTKIRLVKLMRQEADKYKQWKIEREREMSKLKDKDRKLKNEMIRMESMHAKQQIVLKRKFEEASAINKRLKDTLQLQKVVREDRRMSQSFHNSHKLEKIQQYIAQELEILVSTVQAERTLDHLMEERKNAIKQKEALQALEVRNNDISAQLTELNEEIELRTNQINDIRQKISESDQEIKSKGRWEIVQSMSDAKCALKFLFELAGEVKRREILIEANHREEIDEYKRKLNQSEKKLCEFSLHHERQIAQLENEYEEKVFNLLQQMYTEKSGCGDHYDTATSENHFGTAPSQSPKMDFPDQIDVTNENLGNIPLTTIYTTDDENDNEFNENRNENFHDNDDKGDLEENCDDGLDNFMENASFASTVTLDDRNEDFRTPITEDFEDDENISDWEPQKSPSSVRSTSNLAKRSKGSTKRCASTISMIQGDNKSVIKCKCRGGTCQTRQCRCKKTNSECTTNCDCTKMCHNKQLNHFTINHNNRSKSKNNIDNNVIFSNSFMGNARYFEMTGSIQSIAINKNDSSN
ncbi:chromosome-associated kinesin KIF4-like [Chrysoperla carnea]|uniref:chromosome-associated kinesin KIF4-like n=1 Tax=Chrysoperla carnea TaxID=189513 RepID=UPI001D0644BD|nr:chromosome-associated kinesin KIF4-like [Chrysoperla carnea]